MLQFFKWTLITFPPYCGPFVADIYSGHPTVTGVLKPMFHLGNPKSLEDPAIPVGQLILFDSKMPNHKIWCHFYAWMVAQS